MSIAGLLHLILHVMGWTISSAANQIVKLHGEMQEYCETELFTAECGEGEVVFMEQARYGRMKFGRCVDRDYGYVGCSADVRNITDEWCSGQRKCTIPVPNSAFRSTNPCPKDLKPYFGASYTCLGVETNGGRACREGFAKAKLPSGYLSKALAAEHGYGTADCPWLVEARPGQRINISLYDFGNPGSNMVSNTGVCHVTAIIREKGNGDERGATVCGGIGRKRHVYTSTSYAIEVRIIHGSSQGYFLLAYKVFGCANLTPPHNGWAKRRGDVTDVGCDASDKVWRMQCREDTWHGPTENCTEGSSSSGSPGTTIGEVVLGSLLMPFEASIVIIVAIALAIGIIILSFGLICLRWRLNKRAQRRREATKATQLNGVHEKPSRPDVAGEEPPSPMPPEVEPGPIGENEYAYISDMSQPPSSPPFSNGLDHTKDLRQLTSGVYPVGAYERAAAARAGIVKDPRSPRHVPNGGIMGSPGSPRTFTNFGHRRNDSFDYNGNEGLNDSPVHSLRDSSSQNSPVHSRMGHSRNDSIGGQGLNGPRLLAHECALTHRDMSPYSARKVKTRSRHSGDGMSDLPTYFEVDPNRERHYHVTSLSPRTPTKLTSDPRHPATLPNGGVPKNSYVYIDKAAKDAVGKNTL